MTPTTSPDKVLYLDIETYCEADLSKCGVYCYAAHPSFKILLIGYALDDSPAEVYDLTENDRGLYIIRDLIESPKYLKCAHNANFEMTCFKSAGIKVNPAGWCDTMALANYAALPPSLAALSDVLKLGGNSKLSTGTALVSKFSKPKRDGKQVKPESDPESWAAFIEYNRRDVEAEREVYKRLRKYDQPESEHAVFLLDQEINARGIRIDNELARAASELSDEITKQAKSRLVELTGLSNPNSVTQFKQFLSRCGFDRAAFTKNDADEMLSGDLPAGVREAISLKMSISKAAVKKYETMLRAECPDGTCKGMFQYYGSRTGRWAGRLVQLQNLRRNSIPDLDCARQLVKARDLEGLRLAYEDVDASEVLGQLVRTAFIPSAGNKFIIADYSAIEARVIAWLAREKWRQDVFAVDGDIYKSSYSQAFGVPVESVTKPMRQKGKIMELALGYGGGVGAMKRFGADKLGLDDSELQGLVMLWRKSSPAIPALWRSLNNAATAAVSNGSRTFLDRGIEVGRDGKALTVLLPSGRSLYYQNARLEDTPRGTQIVYWDLDQMSRKWKETRTYGGKLTENVIQAIARDCLAGAMIRLTAAGYNIVSHIHDEVIIDAPTSVRVSDVENIMGEPEAWADGLRLTAKGYEGQYYYKD